MSDKNKRLPIRILVVDDEAEVRDAYRQILTETEMSSETAVFHNLRERLFSSAAAAQVPNKQSPSETTFQPQFCAGAEAAVAAVRDSLAAENPFAVVFLDMRGKWRLHWPASGDPSIASSSWRTSTP